MPPRMMRIITVDGMLRLPPEEELVVIVDKVDMVFTTMTVGLVAMTGWAPLAMVTRRRQVVQLSKRMGAYLNYTFSLGFQAFWRII